MVLETETGCINVGPHPRPSHGLLINHLTITHAEEADNRVTGNGALDDEDQVGLSIDMWRSESHSAVPIQADQVMSRH